MNNLSTYRTPQTQNLGIHKRSIHKVSVHFPSTASAERGTVQRFALKVQYLMGSRWAAARIENER